MLLGVLARVRWDRVRLTLVTPRWPGSVVCGSCVSSGLGPLGDSAQERSPVPGRGSLHSPLARTVETLGLASEEARLLDSSLSTEVVETILHSRAPCTP